MLVAMTFVVVTRFHLATHGISLLFVWDLRLESSHLVGFYSASMPDSHCAWNSTTTEYTWPRSKVAPQFGRTRSEDDCSSIRVVIGYLGIESAERRRFYDPR